MQVPVVRVTAAVSAAARTENEQAQDERWLDAATKIVKHLAQTHPDLTTDDVWKAMGTNVPREGRLYGGLMARCKALRYVVPSADEHRPSLRPECHHRLIRVWRSLLYDAPELF